MGDWKLTKGECMSAALTGRVNPLEDIIGLVPLPPKHLVNGDHWSTQAMRISVWRWSAVMKGPWVRRFEVHHEEPVGGGPIKYPNGGFMVVDL